MSEVYVKGLADLQRFLDQVPDKIQRNVLRGGLRAGAAVVKPEVQSNIHSVSGELAKGIKIGTRSRGGVVMATVKAGGPHAFIAKWLEYGTRPHWITSRDGKALSIGGLFFTKAVHHPGIRAFGFMRRALDVKATQAVVAAAEYMKRRLSTKHGLDTADVTIEAGEGDEP